MNALANSSTLASTFTQIWIDTSLQTIRSAAEFWNGVLSPSADATATRAATRTSTAAPWWKAPEPQQTGLPALDPFAWASMWTPAAPAKAAAPDLTQFWAAAWAPWLPQSARPSPSMSNPIEFWQQAWLQNMPQLAAFTASFARPGTLGAAWPGTWPAVTPSAAATPPVPAAWQPMVAAAYRTANGHAMAAVLRTMADVVEPKSRQASISDFWPNPLGMRH